MINYCGFPKCLTQVSFNHVFCFEHRNGRHECAFNGCRIIVKKIKTRFCKKHYNKMKWLELKDLWSKDSEKRKEYLAKRKVITKNYRINNPEKVRVSQHNYQKRKYSENPTIFLDRNKIYRQNNKDKINKQRRKHYALNKDRINEKRRLKKNKK